MQAQPEAATPDLLHPAVPRVAGRARRMPGEAGIWIVVFGDMAMFGALFAILLDYRTREPALFAASHAAMGQGFGLVNTGLMLTSSWFVALAVQALRRGRGDVARRLVMLAIACGIGFGVVKYFEYSDKIAAGHTLMANDFFMFYFVYTGIHLVHVVIGTLLLAAIAVHLGGRSSVSAMAMRNIESGGVFWHLVDLLWIVIFALFYLVR